MKSKVEAKIVMGQAKWDKPHPTISLSLWVHPEETALLDLLISAKVIDSKTVSPTYEPDGFSVHWYTHFEPDSARVVPAEVIGNLTLRDSDIT